MGVMMLYVIYYPFEKFLLFWLIPVPLWVLLGMYVLYDLHPVLLALAGDPSSRESPTRATSAAWPSGSFIGGSVGAWSRFSTASGRPRPAARRCRSATPAILPFPRRTTLI